MDKKTVRLVLDRIEEGVAVLTDGESGVYECPASLLPEGSHEDSHFDAEIGSVILSLTAVDDPGAGENKKRLLRLFEKSAKNKDHGKGSDE